ncbi:hypothetical protein AB0B94_04250 [Micromonospora sp. NPDC048986]|uniref:hypothetical protein n=1 Tax=Micromonospora sp. NPDC048986 TaxID=3155644 RepID=UPI00340B357E
MTAIQPDEALAQAYDGITAVVGRLDDAGLHEPPAAGAGSSPTCSCTCSATPSGHSSHWPAPSMVPPTSTT